MCQHFENTHRRYSPSISGKRKEHQRYFCQVGWSFYYPCPSPADAPASIRPWLALANPLYSPFPGHFSALSSCHVHSSLCSKSFGESIRYSIFEKTVKFGKNIPAQEKIFNENFARIYFSRIAISSKSCYDWQNHTCLVCSRAAASGTPYGQF